MAEAVESALAEKKHLIVEAGTGTGKTLAYLVPAILSGKRVVISTGTKNLQEQLFFKDIPFLEKHLGPLRACYMKGPRQLRLPPENLRRRKRAGAGGSGRGRRFSDDPSLGKDHRNRRSRRDQEAAREQLGVGQDGRARRAVQRPEVPAVRALLHHPHAPEGRRKRPDHRQPPPVLRRSRGEGRRARRDHPGLQRRDLRRSSRGGGCRRAVLRRIDFERPGGGSDARCGLARPSQAVRQRGAGPHSDHLDRPGRAVFWAVRTRRKAARDSARTRRSSKRTKKPIATCCGRWRWSRCNWSC